MKSFLSKISHYFFYRVLIIIPRMDLVWNRDVDENHIFYSIKDDKNWQLRIDWFSFASYLAFYFQTKGYKADIEYKPMYEIKQKRYLAYSHVFYPHMNNKIMRWGIGVLNEQQRSG